MTINELAVELGKAIKADERITKLNETRAAFEANSHLQQLTLEYEIQQRALANEYAKPERDDKVIDLVQKRAEEIYLEVSESPEYKAMVEAEEAVNLLMNEVNSTITQEITGEAPCTHDCSTCGRQCH